MAQPGQTTIQLYATSTAAATPSSANLVSGELALNLTDKKVFTKDGSGNVVEMTPSPTNALAVASGGTGATSAASARTNLDALAATNPSYTGTLTGGTGVVNLGSGQFVKDAAGNIGLGAIPASSGTALQFRYGSGITSAASGDINFTSNAYDSGAGVWRYHTTGVGASRYKSDFGTHAWYTAPSGTAGDPISFTQAMTLTTAGQLLIGRTSPLDGATALTASINTSSDPYVSYFSNESTSTSAYNVSRWAQGASGSAIGFVGTGGSAVGNAAFANNFVVGTQTANSLVFATADVERARIDTGGNLLVGTTAGGARIVAHHSGVSVGVRSENTDTAGTTNTLFFGKALGVDRFYVFGNGNVQNVNNSYGAISDLKLKENVDDVSPKLAKLLQVRIVNYTLKSDPDKTKLIGVIAQELEQISPGLIEETPDYEEVKRTREVDVPAVEAVLDDEGNEVTPAVPASTKTEEYTERVDLGTVTKSVKYSVFVPMLIKGLQEQHAIVEALQTQLDAQNTAMQLLADRLAALEAA